MTLMDHIIDEAEELAYQRRLPNDASDRAIIDAVSECVSVKLGYNSTGGKLALAAYHRVDNAVRQVVAA